MKPLDLSVECQSIADNFTGLASQRYSCRSFAGKPIPSGPLDRLNACVSALNRTNAPIPRLELFPAASLRKENLFSTGTYGLIRKPSAYLAGITIPGTMEDWMALGRAMQVAVMQATALDIQSCWIGGVFDRRTCRRVLALSPEEQVPAVIALGTAARRRTLQDRLVRWSARGATRRAFGALFFDRHWGEPLDPARYPGITPLLENLRRAPSASNRQPWRAVVRENELDLYLQRTPGYQRLTPGVDLQAVDMGIAICHLELSAREMGIRLTWGGIPAPVSDQEEPIRTFRLKTKS